MMRFAMLCLLLVVASCTHGTERPVVSTEVQIDDDGVQRVDVDMHSYYFEPSRIIVKAGKPVEIVLHNSSHIVPHNFTIASEDISVSQDKWGWGSAKVRFTPEKPGEYRFFCHKGGHEQKGMVGTLLVMP